MDICCGYFRGQFYLKKYGDAAAPLLPMGNVSAFSISHNVTDITQEDFTALGGTACAISYINSVTASMTLNCLNKENLAIAFQGTATALTVNSVTDESHTVKALGELIPLAFIPKKITVIVNDDQVAPTTFTEGTDYIITSAGIIPLVGGTIAPADVLEISYSYGLGNIIEGVTTGQQSYELIFDGANSGEDGDQEVVMRIWKIKFGPTATFNLLNTGEFGSIEITGVLLKDDTKVGSGKSKYYNFESREIV